MLLGKKKKKENKIVYFKATGAPPLTGWRKVAVGAVGFNITLSRPVGCVTQISTPRWSLRKASDEKRLCYILWYHLLFPSGKPHIRESQSENDTRYMCFFLFFFKGLYVFQFSCVLLIGVFL